MNELVQAGEWDAAEELYRETAGVTWNAARAAVERWEDNAVDWKVEWKLALLARHLEAPPAHTPATASAGGLSAEPGAAAPDPTRMEAFHDV